MATGTRLAALCAAVLTATAGAYDVADVEGIDPYSPEAGSFLDIDLEELERAAREEYLAGNWEKAARLYLAALRYDVADAGNIYNLACCYGLLGEAELAARYLTASVEAGFSNLGHMQWDPDLDPVRGDPAFAAAMDSITAAVTREQEAMGQMLYMDSKALLPCRVHAPIDLEEAGPLPLVVGLHGYGDNPDSFAGLWRAFEDHDLIFACPRAPFEMEGVDFRGYTWMIGEPESEVFERAAPVAEEYVLGVVEDLKSRYDVSSVWLMGHSQGAGFTYQIGLRNPDVFSGLMPNAGWLDREWIPDSVLAAASDVPVFVIHGHEDEIVEYQAALDAVETLEEFGYRVELFDFRGGHTVPEEGLQAARQWMREMEVD